LTLLTPAHGEITVGPDRCPDVFWATVGGLGLTGVILRAAVRLAPAETAWMCCRDERLGDLDAALAGLRAAHRSGRFAAAWLDGCARGDRIGRGVLSTCWPARLDDLPLRRRRAARAYRRRRPLPIPQLPGPGVVNGRAVRAANAVHLRLAPRGRAVTRPTSIALHPLDAMHGWPGLYGRRGLVQYQCAVPFGNEAVLREILTAAVTGGCPPSLVVLKQFGAADPAPLSFPVPGWTLALDFPAAATGLAELLDAADSAVADARGRVYLVKDGRLRPEMVPPMYPGLDRWRAVRATLDPDRRLCSDLSRRLRLID